MTVNLTGKQRPLQQHSMSGQAQRGQISGDLALTVSTSSTEIPGGSFSDGPLSNGSNVAVQAM